MHPANRLNLDYRAEAARMPAPPCPIIDVHTHLSGGQAAKVYAEVAELYGIVRAYSMTPLEQIPEIAERLGDRVRFIAAPDMFAQDRGHAFRDGYAQRLTEFRKRGAGIAKFWSAPRGVDFAEEAGEPPDLFDLTTSHVQRNMQHAVDLGMIIMVHVGDPDTWFATRYADASRYGTKRQQYDPLIDCLHRYHETPFIAAHFGGWPENLTFLSRLLATHSNLYLDSSATKWIVRAWSRHDPEQRRQFLKRWRGRILFGSDIVTRDGHVSSGGHDAEDQKAASPAEAFDLYASRYWALRTLFETDYDGPSPIADPDLHRVDPNRYEPCDAPRLRGSSLPTDILCSLYHDAADRLLSRRDNGAFGARAVDRLAADATTALSQRNVTDDEATVDQLIVQPAFDQWEELLRSNRGRENALRWYGQLFDRSHLIRNTVKLAIAETQRLHDAADRAGIDIGRGHTLDDVDQRAVDLSLVMTGHQPVVFHPGLDFKYQLTESFAVESGAVAIALSLDTDAGSAGVFQLPVPDTLSRNWSVSGQMTCDLTQQREDSGSELLYRNALIATASTLQSVRQRGQAQLLACELSGSADVFGATMEVYERLAEQPATLAHAIARRWAGRDRNLLHLPLSSWLEEAEIKRWMAVLIRNGIDLARRYNQSLHDWRSARKIRNPANPFPDLRIESERIELPMWWIDLQEGVRHALFGEIRGEKVIRLWADNDPLADVGSLDNEWVAGPTTRIAPRGALLSLMYRWLGSDLFVHGLGGQAYDAFTNEFAKHQLAWSPPSFVTASRTRYLLRDQYARLVQLERDQQRQRQIAHHVERYLGKGMFRDGAEAELADWAAEKTKLVGQLKAKKQAGESAAEEGRRLQALQHKVKQCVQLEMDRYLAPLVELSDAARDAITCRTYPWFLFVD